MMVRKQHEVEYLSLYGKEYNYGLIGWSPLAGGFLTGKYLEGVKPEHKTRMTGEGKQPAEMMQSLFLNPHNSEQNLKNLSAIQKYA